MQLSHKLDVAEKLVLFLQYLLRDLCLVNLLTRSLSLFLWVVLLEDVLETLLTLFQQLADELTMLIY